MEGIKYGLDTNFAMLDKVSEYLWFLSGICSLSFRVHYIMSYNGVQSSARIGKEKIRKN